MKGTILTMCLLLSLLSPAFSQLNVQLLHQLVAQSKSEHARQQQARDKQAVTTANEQVNSSQMSSLKVKYRELQNRFHTASLAIDAAQIGLEASPVVSEIIHWQQVIFQLASSDPLLIALAIRAEVEMSSRATMLINYIVALAVSIGDINQMKASDRKLLFSHALTELRLIEGASRGLARSMMHAGRKNGNNPFADFLNQEKPMAEEIIRNLERIRP